MSTIRRLHESVVLREENGARFALDLERGEILDLNESAALLVELLREGAAMPGLVAALRERYPEVGEAEATRDVEDALAELSALGFLA